jgi:hypothetical protein
MSSPEPHDAAPVALVDLGDTLADCTPGLEAALRRLHPGGSELREAPPLASLEARRRVVLATPGFWRGLAPRAAGFELLGLLRDAGFQVHVLTKGPRDAPQVWADKVAWCRAHLPGVPVTVTDDKARMQGDVLVDDWLPYVERWQRRWPAGLVVVPAQPWNAQLPAGLRCLRDDGRDRDGLLAALKAVAARVDRVPPGGPPPP